MLSTAGSSPASVSRCCSNTSGCSRAAAIDGAAFTKRAVEESEAVKAELLADPEVRRAYDELAPEYEIARAVIRARTARGLTQAELAELRSAHAAEAERTRAEHAAALDALRSELAANGLGKYEHEELETLCHNKEVINFVLKDLNSVGKSNQFAPMEMLQSIVLVPEELPLTAAQKVQRKEVESKYGDAIKKVYP